MEENYLQTITQQVEPMQVAVQEDNNVEIQYVNINVMNIPNGIHGKLISDLLIFSLFSTLVITN